MPFVRAGPAEVLRASQKDETAIKHLQERLERLFLYVSGLQTYVKHKNAVQFLGKFLFYLNTTLSGLQTLGEEYTGIVQVDSSLRRIPSKSDLWLTVLLECLGPSLLTHIQTIGKKRICERMRTAADDAEKSELNFFGFLLNSLPLLSHFHKALFFYQCGTYHLSKRVTGIQYVLVRFWLKDRGSVKGFRILGLVSMLQLLTLLCQNAFEALTRGNESSSYLLQHEDNSSIVASPEVQPSPGGKRCIICMENLSSPTSTPCGHIFCWGCITEWAQNEERCPVCREPVASFRLIPLRNYG